MNIVVCVLGSTNIWTCGISELPTLLPGSPSASSTPSPTPTPTPTPTPISTPEPTSGPGPGPETPPPSADPTGDPTAGPRPHQLPSDLLDLSDWFLTLPTGAKGDPDSVRQPALTGFHNPYFRLNDAGDGVVFTANAGGTTTRNSSYPRSELREMSGGQNADWSNESGTHALSVRQAVTELPPVKPEIVTAQIHDAHDDVMQVRLEGHRLVAAYDDGRREVTIDPDYRLGTVFDLTIVAADHRVRVFYNGMRKAEIDRAGSGWYFKSGTYLQSNPSRGDRPNAIGQVVIYALDVRHSD
jgi:hypothetical protein